MFVVFASGVFRGIPGEAFGAHGFAYVFSGNVDGADFPFVAAAVAFEFRRAICTYIGFLRPKPSSF